MSESKETPKLLKIALLQIAPGKTLEENLEKGLLFCRKAREAGADIALFPEMWSNGYNIYNRPVEEWTAEAISADSAFVRSFGEAAKELNMIAYLSKTQKNLEALSWFEIVQVPREANIDADALVRLASGIDEEGEGSIPIEVLTQPYVLRGDVGVVDGTPPPSWMTPLVEFLKRGVIPEDKEEAKKLRSLAPKYTMREDNLFKRVYSMPLLRCLTEVEAKKVLREVHEGVCGNHAAG